jgi:signal transduction histidine kinase
MGVGGDVIVLWAAAESADTCVWVTHAPPGVRVMLSSPDTLGRAVPAALARGPVIAIVSNDRDAHRALALGVDEVIRANAATHDTLSVAAESARLRAIGRDTRPTQPTAVDEDAKAMELLAASVGYRLANPLAVASLNVEILRTAMGAMTGLADAYVRDAASRSEQRDSESMRVVALRASAPPSAELHATMDDLSRALREASVAVSQVYSLVAPDEFDEVCDLCAVVSEVAKLVGAVVDRVAELRIDLPNEPCRAVMPRSQVVQALSALLSNALQAVRDRGQRGTITVRVWAREDVALLEVIDNGVGMSPSVRSRAMEAFFTTRGGAATGLGLSMVAERVRRAGGEVVLESEQGLGTTVRLFVPLAPPAQETPRDIGSN